MGGWRRRPTVARSSTCSRRWTYRRPSSARRSASSRQPAWRDGPRDCGWPSRWREAIPSAKVEPVERHDLVPGGGEVADELLAGVVGGVDLRERSKLRVGAEDEVGGGGGPPDLAGPAVAPLVDVLRSVGRGPLRAHVEEVHEEVVRQRL